MWSQEKRLIAVVTIPTALAVLILPQVPAAGGGGFFRDRAVGGISIDAAGVVDNSRDR